MLEQDKIQVYITGQSIADYRLQGIANQRINLSPVILRFDQYSFVTQNGSKLTEIINETLLNLQKQDVTFTICKEYLTKGAMNCHL